MHSCLKKVFSPIIMDILEDVRKVTEGGIDCGSVVTIIAITLIAAVVFIFFESVTKL